MRTQRKVVVKLIQSEKIHNHRLLAEFFANKFKEREIYDENISSRI